MNKMNKWWPLLLIISCLVGAELVISGIRQAQNRGHFPLPNNPNRIISLAPSISEILFAIGLGDKIVGVTLYCDYPPAVEKKTRVGGFWWPNTEAIIATRPDLVITLQIAPHKDTADTLRRLGYQVLTLKIEKIEELFTAIQKIGATTGCKQQANELVGNIRNQLSDLQHKFSSTNKVRMLWVSQVEPLRVAGRNTFINELIELAGGQNAIGPTIAQYPSISAEELLACGAEVIIQSAMETGNTAEQQAAEKFWSRWASLPAVKNNRIYVVEPDTVVRLGPRICRGAELIARCLHTSTPARKQDAAQQTR